jgi:putative transposase
MTTTPCIPSYAGYRFPAEVIGYAVYLYFRFPLRVCSQTGRAGLC